MKNHNLYSLILELYALETTPLPLTTGHLTHALFLDMIAQVEPALAARLHDEQDYRPFTVSALLDVAIRDGQLQIQAGAVYRVRITLLDGGEVWECLTRRILEERQLLLRIGRASFRVERLLSTAGGEVSSWAAHTTWQGLTTGHPEKTITLRFASPTAFSLGSRHFALFPEPRYVWDSLLRTWNCYAPDILAIDKRAFREYVVSHVSIVNYALHTTTIQFPKFHQGGFLGTCTYLLKQETRQSEEHLLFSVATLARFALYAGVGYKTTMGMGQVRLEDGQGHIS